MEILLDDLQGAAVAVLLREHLEAMHASSPPESVHALDLEALRHPSVRFWTAWEQGSLLGCGVLKQHSSELGELKSMRTASAHMRRGVARALLRHIEADARDQGLQRISLETGSHAPFAAARNLYASEGYVPCGPFADYVADPYSAFMSKAL